MSDILTSPSGQRMLSYIAPIYGDSAVMKALFQVSGVEMDDLRGWVQEIRLQSWPQTATWGLRYWEQLLGIETDEAKPIAERREYIQSKVRSTGTPTRKFIEEAALSFTGGRINVTNSETPYTIIIQFIDDIGSPPNMEDFVAFVDNVIPAHVDAEYSYRYFIIQEIDGVMTIANLETQPLNKFAPFI